MTVYDQHLDTVTGPKPESKSIKYVLVEMVKYFEHYKNVGHTWS